MPETDLNLLARAAEAAGEIALKHWKNRPRTWDKPGGAGPVTEADLEVDAALAELLRGARPDYGWLSEETEDDKTRLAREHTFILDPIDGTRAFIGGETNWAISIAVAHRGAVEAGAIYLPALDAIYLAGRGTGATRNGEPIATRPAPRADEADIIAAKPNLDPGFWRHPVPAFRRHFRPSLAYRMALVAEGRYDAMLTFRPAWEWDIAAGALICEEAGAVASTQSGAPLVFNNPVPRLAGVVVAPEPLHAEIRSRLRDMPG